MRAKEVRKSGGRIWVDLTVEVDAADVLSELDDADLRAECDIRGIPTGDNAADDRESFFDLMDEMRETFDRQDRLHFEVLLLRMQNMAGVTRLTITPRPKDYTPA